MDCLFILNSSCPESFLLRLRSHRREHDCIRSHELLRSEEWFALGKLNHLDLVSHPVIEEVKDKGPDGLECMRIVLIVIA
jgi:hypothetical protein